MIVGGVTPLTVIPLPVRSAGALAVESQFAAAARLKVVVSTAEVPALFKSPLTASLSAAFNVTENAVALLAVVVLLVSV
ncbi:hypothetical protein DBV10_14315 [Acidovorax sp. FJL06]|nr:hypothetical protein DBV10_14315 [Acidovorax sp. FJL06]